MRFALACALAVVAVLLVGCGGKQSPTSGTYRGGHVDGGCERRRVEDPRSDRGRHAEGGRHGVERPHRRRRHERGQLISLDLKLVRGKGRSGPHRHRRAGLDVVRIDELYFKGSKKFSSMTRAGRRRSSSPEVVRRLLERDRLLLVSALTTLDVAREPILSSQRARCRRAPRPRSTASRQLRSSTTANGGTLYVATTARPTLFELKPGKGKGSGAISSPSGTSRSHQGRRRHR